jgi:hypothetical protein
MSNRKGRNLKQLFADINEEEDKEDKEDKEEDDAGGDNNSGRLDEAGIRCLKKHIKFIDKRWDDLQRENNRLKTELRKALSSNSRGTKGDIRKDNCWNSEVVNLSDWVTVFCRDYLFPGFKFLSDDWQNYNEENEQSLSYFVQRKIKMMTVNAYEDLWDRVMVPTICLKYQTICCNLNNVIGRIYRGESLNWELIYCLCL